MKHNILLALLLTAFLGSGCSVSKRLAPYTAELQRAAASTMPPEEKLEVLAVTTTRALRESLTFVNPKKTGQFVDAFAKQNDRAIGSILSELEGSISSMNAVEKVGFFARTARQPYINELKTEVKKIERKTGRKIKTFRFLSRLFGFLNPLGSGG